MANRIGSAKAKHVDDDGTRYTFQWWDDGRVERIAFHPTPDGKGYWSHSIGVNIDPPIPWNPDDFEEFHEG